jgi:FkbM family methyltransferase
MMDKVKREKYHVLVLDMQVIDPPTGGGRQRLLGLYHGLGKELPTTYVGTYDWPGEKFRKHHLSETLEEINIPLSDKHFKLCQQWQSRVGGKTIIDTAFHQMAHLSPKFVKYAQNEVLKADIVIFSHPWVYPLVKKQLRKHPQLVVYDSHNIEGLIKLTLLDDNAFGTEIVKKSLAMEYELCHQANRILACSEEDKANFNRFYHVPLGKIEIIPNGVFARTITPVDEKTKRAAKKQLGHDISKPLIIFLGSAYQPNIEAAHYIGEKLAPHLQDVTFAICGGVGDGLKKETGNKRTSNVHITGFLTEKEKALYLKAADVAINPMFSGSGTNVKMFDFMAAAIPTVTTPTGARGIVQGPEPAFVISNSHDFVSQIKYLLNDSSKMQVLAQSARRLVEKKYSWEKISQDLGTLLSKWRREIDISSRSIKDTSTPHQKDMTIHDLSLKRSLQKQPQIAILTPWATRCGIAEYSRYLVNSFIERNVQCQIFSQHNGSTDNCDIIPEGYRHIAIWKIWHYSHIDPHVLINICHEKGIQKLNIQYHRGFFSEEHLINVVRAVVDKGIDVSITLHDSRSIDKNILSQLSHTGAQLCVHSYDEIKRLSDLNIMQPVHIPHGVIEIPDEPVSAARHRLGINSSVVIGSFGFLRPHKGIVELIKAIDFLKVLFPDILLLGMNALYPSDDSKDYLSYCQKLIRQRQLNKHVMLKTDFFEIEDVISHLHACDFVVLPYHSSSEGASGAANIVVAAKRALITTRSDIFTNISDITYTVNDIKPSLLAQEIATLISDSSTLKSLKKKVEKYVEKNSWTIVADKYLKVIFKTSPESLNLLVPPGIKNSQKSSIHQSDNDSESSSSDLIKKIIRPGMKCLDVGAGNGAYTVLMAKLAGEQGTVYTFEPMPARFEPLVQRLEKEGFHKRINSFQLLCSNRTGKITITELADRYITAELAVGDKRSAQCIRLDDIIKEPIDLIRISAKGHELLALEGMMRLILKKKPVIISHINDYWLKVSSHSSGNEFIGFLTFLGYNAYDIHKIDEPLGLGSLKIDFNETRVIVALPERVIVK